MTGKDRIWQMERDLICHKEVLKHFPNVKIGEGSQYFDKSVWQNYTQIRFNWLRSSLDLILECPIKIEEDISVVVWTGYNIQLVDNYSIMNYTLKLEQYEANPELYDICGRKIVEYIIQHPNLTLNNVANLAPRYKKLLTFI